MWKAHRLVGTQVNLHRRGEEIKRGSSSSQICKCRLLPLWAFGFDYFAFKLIIFICFVLRVLLFFFTTNVGQEKLGNSKAQRYMLVLPMSMSNASENEKLHCEVVE